jgi:hypothetical protein
MTYFKEQRKKFYSKLMSFFVQELKSGGLRFKDTTFQENFLTFITSSLKKALDKTFIDMSSNFKQTPKK